MLIPRNADEAQFTAQGTIRRAADGKLVGSTDFSEKDLTAWAKSRAADPTIFDDDKHKLFIFSVTVSNDTVDSYFTKMSPRTLAGFARDAALGDNGQGVAVLDSHDGRRLGVGRSITGSLVDNGVPVAKHSPDAEGQIDLASLPHSSDNRFSMDSTFYTTAGIGLGAGGSYATTDDMIAAIRSGQVRDISVGFRMAGENDLISCSVCGKEMYNSSLFGLWNYECEHVPGVTYPVLNDDGSVQSVRMCYGLVQVDGTNHMMEYSVVSKGATSGAGINRGQAMPLGFIRAESLIAMRAIDRDTAQKINDIYAPITRGARLPVPPKSFVLDPTENTFDEMTRAIDVAFARHTGEITVATTKPVTRNDDSTATTTDDAATALEDAAGLLTDEQVDNLELAQEVGLDPDDVEDEDDLEEAVATTEDAEPTAGESVEVPRGVFDQLCRSVGVKDGDVDGLLRKLPSVTRKLNEHKTLRTNLVERTKRAAVQNDLDPEKIAKLLERAPVSEIQDHLDDLRRSAAARFKSGRRSVPSDQTDDNTPAVEDATVVRQVPAAAYR